MVICEVLLTVDLTELSPLICQLAKSHLDSKTWFPYNVSSCQYSGSTMIWWLSLKVEKIRSYQLYRGWETLHVVHQKSSFLSYKMGLEWSGGAMVLGKLPVPGRPTNLDFSRARAYCAYSTCGWGYLDIFSLVYHFSFSLSLSERQPDIDWSTVSKGH